MGAGGCRRVPAGAGGCRRVPAGGRRAGGSRAAAARLHARRPPVASGRAALQCARDLRRCRSDVHLALPALTAPSPDRCPLIADRRLHTPHRYPTTQHAATRARASGPARVAGALVARAAGRAGGHGAARGARRGVHAGAARARRRGRRGRRSAAARAPAAGAPGARLRLHRHGQRAGLRRRVGRAHEPGGDAGRRAVRAGAGGRGRGLRAGAAAGRRAGLRRAAGAGAGRRARRGRGLHAARRGRVGAGRGRRGGAAHGHAGLRVLRRVGRARPRAPRPRRARQVRPHRRRPRLHRGLPNWHKLEPCEKPSARATPELLARPLGVLGGSAVGRGARHAAAPARAAAPAPRAPRTRRSPRRGPREPLARGAAAAGQGGRPRRLSASSDRRASRHIHRYVHVHSRHVLTTTGAKRRPPIRLVPITPDD